MDRLHAYFRKLRARLRHWLNEGQVRQFPKSSPDAKIVEKPLSEVVEVVRGYIREGRSLYFPVKGRSMRIFIESARDRAILSPFDAATLKRGDVVLTKVDEGGYVLHRIVKAEDDVLTLMGDGNFRGTEHCRRSDVVAKATGFFRKGRTKPDMVTGMKWRVYSVLWMNLLPVRRWLLLAWRIKIRLLRS